jgi:hypothetical protein
MLTRSHRRDRTCVDYDGIHLQRLGHALREEDILDGIAVAQHGEDDGCALDCRSCGICDLSAISGKRLGFRAITVPYRYGKARRKQAACHRCSHESRTQERDLPCLIGHQDLSSQLVFHVNADDIVK